MKVEQNERFDYIFFGLSVNVSGIFFLDEKNNQPLEKMINSSSRISDIEILADVDINVQIFCLLFGGNNMSLRVQHDDPLADGFLKMYTFTGRKQNA